MISDALLQGLGLAFTSSAVPQWVFDRETFRILAVNAAALGHYGCSREEFLTRTILDLCLPTERRATETDARNLSCTPVVDPRIRRHLVRDGEMGYMKMAFSDLTVQNRPARLVQAFDVTDHVRLEQERDGTLRLEREARAQVDASNRTRGTAPAAVSDPHEPLRAPAAVSAVAPSNAEHRSFARDLRAIAEAIRLRSSDGREILKGELDTVPTPLLLADDALYVVGANRAAETLTGYSHDDLGHIRVADLIAMGRDATEEHWGAFAKDGMQEGIVVLRRKDGSRVSVGYSAITNVRPGLHLSALDGLA